MSINKNYITPEGFKLLQEELNNLIKQERPDLVKVISWAAGNGDRSENGDYIYGKKRLRQIDARIKFLLINIEDANIIHFDEKMDQSKIFFGAKVKLFDENEEKEIKENIEFYMKNNFNLLILFDEIFNKCKLFLCSYEIFSENFKNYLSNNSKLLGCPRCCLLLRINLR